MSAGGYSYGSVERHHGARCAITNDSGVVKHTEDSHTATTLLRSYRDGVRIGCTFVSNEALRTIWNLHSMYLEGKDSVTHQAGY